GGGERGGGGGGGGGEGGGRAECRGGSKRADAARGRRSGIGVVAGDIDDDLALRAVAQNGEHELAGAALLEPGQRLRVQLAHLIESGDRQAVDAHQQVARQQSAARRVARRTHPAHIQALRQLKV